MGMCLYQVGMKYDRSYVADAKKDIGRQKSILTRFDTFLILPLFRATSLNDVNWVSRYD